MAAILGILRLAKISYLTAVFIAAIVILGKGVQKAMTARAEPGVHERRTAVQVGELTEGGVVGDLVILGFCRKQRLPYDQLRAIYLNAGLEENQLPKRRAAVDAFRLAISTLKDQKLATRDHGILKILVRDWKGGRTPRKDLTLEKQNSYADRFEYTSPAVCIYYDADKEAMVWDNRLNPETESEAYHKLEGLLAVVKEEFLLRRNLVDGDAIYYSLQELIDQTAPLPLGAGSFLIWKEHKDVVNALKSVITALNNYNDVNPSEQSSVNIFTVVNTENDRETLSSALDQTIAREVQVGIERIARIMRTPDSLFQYQGQVELENYSKLKKLADEYSVRFRKERTRIDAQLQMLWKQHEAMMVAVAKNSVRKAQEKAQKKEESNAVV